LTAASSRRGGIKEDEEEKRKDEEEVDDEDSDVSHDKKSKKSRSLYKTILDKLGPGIITGASDADPSGIALGWY
jgi:hypothetical protein